MKLDTNCSVRLIIIYVTLNVFLLHFEFAICDALSWFLIEIILALNLDLVQIKPGLSLNHIGP
jgi:hypothetical protein